MVELNIRATDLSDLMEVSKATVSFWLSGTNGVRGIKLMRLSEVLRCSPAWLMEGVGEAGPSLDEIQKIDLEASLGKLVYDRLSAHGSQSPENARDLVVKLIGMAEGNMAPPELWGILDQIVEMAKRAG